MENRFFACIVPKVFNIWVFVRPLRSLDKTKCLVVAIAVGNRCLIYLLFSCHNSILPIAIVFGCFFGCSLTWESITSPQLYLSAESQPCEI